MNAFMKLILFLFLLQDPSSWVDKLGTGSDALRWEAVEHLSRLGADGAGIVETCPDEWWRRIALAEWKARRTAGKNYAEPLRLTLDFREGEGSRLATDLAEKAGIELTRRTLVAGNVVLEKKEGTWFELLGELGREAGLDIRESQGGAYQIVPGLMDSQHRSLSRNYEISLVSFVEATHAIFDRKPFQQTALQFSIRSDPGGRILKVKNGSLVRAVTGSGRELVETDLVQAIRGGRSRSRDMSAHLFEIALEPFDSDGEKIGLLRGSVRIVIPARVVHFKIAPRFEGNPFRAEKEGVTVVVKMLRYRNRMIDLVLSIRSTHAGTVYPAGDRIRVLDDVGLMYRSTKRAEKYIEEGGKEYTLSFRNFNNVGDPKSITLSVVTKTSDRTVYFSFKDVPLR